MTNSIRPMLACQYDDWKAKHPGEFKLYSKDGYIVQPKIDGIRCLIVNGQAVSRSGKLLPNRMLQAIVAQHPEIEGFDGELVLPSIDGKPYADFPKTESAVMSANSLLPLKYIMFDFWNRGTQPYLEVFKETASLHYVWRGLEVSRIICGWAPTHEWVIGYAETLIKQGYEGVILRHPLLPYKHGRATPTKGELIKWKPFIDAEAWVVSINELMVNENEKERSELGYAKRSSAKSGLSPGDMMGSLTVKGINGPFADTTFEIGTGFTAEDRLIIWNHREDYCGRVMTYKYLPSQGYDKPRHPVFLHWRKEI